MIRGILNLSQGTYVLQNFTDEGLIFCQLIKLPFGLFWEKTINKFE